jgi:signal transduction histidine kinase
VAKDDLSPLGPAVAREIEYARSATLSHRLLAAQEAERRRIARALHDDLGQLVLSLRHSLLALAQSVDVTEPLARLDAITQRIRDASLDLWPSILDDLGLAAAVRWLADRQTRRGLTVFAAVDDVGRMPIAIEAACFRIAQEALTNVARHAGASRAAIHLRASGATLALVVTDDGCGFDPAEAWGRAVQGAGLGLLGMRENATLAGGHLEVESAPGVGTTVRLSLPRAREPVT